jgi:hypothetical protein
MVFLIRTDFTIEYGFKSSKRVQNHTKAQLSTSDFYPLTPEKSSRKNP